MTDTQKSNGLQKFAPSATDPKANKFGITNSRGEGVTREYLNHYVQCWCRLPEYENPNRKVFFAYFASDKFLSTCVGLTASQVGHKASIDPRWGLNKTAKRPIGAAKPAASAPADQQPEVPADPAPVEPTFEQTLAEEPAITDESVSQPTGEPEAITPASNPEIHKRGKKHSATRSPASRPMTPPMRPSPRSIACSQALGPSAIVRSVFVLAGPGSIGTPARRLLFQ